MIDRLSTARSIRSRTIVGMRVDGTSYEEAADIIISRAVYRKAGYVCAANVHMAMECHDDDHFHSIVNDAILITPDGMPLVWMLRALGFKDQSRVYGPTLMLHVCDAAERAGIAIGLFGGAETTLTTLHRNLRERYPRLRIDYSHAPPFRLLTVDEDIATVAAINASGVGVLFVGLGCPKQERWMAAHVAMVAPVMIGVGAAFAFHAGQVRQAPAWMQRIGMEWLFRLCVEPRRLWRRYFWNNPRFVVLALLQLMSRRGRVPPDGD